MKKLLLYLAEMQRRGLIANYALGGATALIYYFEPIQTQDIDVFVVLAADSQPLVNLSPIYSFLSDQGARAEKEYVVIDDVPVQFLVPYNELVEEAVHRAIIGDFDGVEVRIPPLEYLMAIMVQTGRGKDKARLEALRSHPELYSQPMFEEILARFQLTGRWEKILKWMQS